MQRDSEFEPLEARGHSKALFQLVVESHYPNPYTDQGYSHSPLRSAWYSFDLPRGTLPALALSASCNQATRRRIVNEASIAKRFGTYFSLKLATTPELLAQVYRVRYEVYCAEFRYLSEEECPAQMERDEYDARAQHCLMIHVPTQRPVGCIRLVQPEHDGRVCVLPFETFCATYPEYSVSSDELPRIRVGEMSRLAVIEQFRRRKKDEKKPISFPEDEDSDPNERRSNFPMIPVGLFTAGMSMFLRSSTDFAFALMEPRLARLLQRFGIMFTQAGEIVDHYGRRAPFVLPREKAAGTLPAEVQELFRHVDRQLFGMPGDSGAPLDAP